MATKKKAQHPAADVIAAARLRAEQTRRQFENKPGLSELLTPQELADAAPFYFVLRDYIRQLKEAREGAGVTLAELATRSGLAIETLSRLETGALTNPTWKTLGVYAAALRLRPCLTTEAIASNRKKKVDAKKPPTQISRLVRTTGTRKGNCDTNDGGHAGKLILKAEPKDTESALPRTAKQAKGKRRKDARQ